MRSLTLLSERIIPLPSIHPLSKTYICRNTDENEIYIAYLKPEGVAGIAKADVKQGLFLDIATFLPSENLEPSANAIIGIKYLGEDATLCVVLANGEIGLVRIDDISTEFVDIVGAVDAGISAMSWSPDEELVVLLTGSHSVLLMTKSFEPVAEFPMQTRELGAAAPVNVGWGKKETQFHGSEGKSAAKHRPDYDNFELSPDDDGLPRVSWHGDGRYFVVSSVDKEINRRVLRIYNREGVLQNTSEPVNKLEHSLCWRPLGNLIASTQRLPHRHDVVFFEPNGLRHGEFSLRETGSYRVIEVFWNADSSVLGVWLERTTKDGIIKTCVQLWTMNNYHWYLKQEIHLCLASSSDDSIAGVYWDPEVSLRLYLVSKKNYHCFTYTMEVLTNSTTSSDSSSIVAVIDGSNLLLTPFRFQNVPPPMASYVLSLGAPILSIAFDPEGGEKIAILCVDGSISFVEGGLKDGKWVGDLKLWGMITLCSGNPTTSAEALPNPAFLGMPRQLCWINSTTLIYWQYRGTSQQEILAIQKLILHDADHIYSAGISTVKSIHETVLRLVANPSFGDLILQTIDGDLLDIKITEDINNDETTKFDVILSPMFTLPEASPWIATTRFQDNPDQVIVISLSDRNKLYANDRLVVSDATSFYLHRDFLVFTTTSHITRYLELEGSLNDFKLPDKVASPYDESLRRVERGSKIVVAVQGSNSLVLQMPRGNLETIFPRAFVLSSVRHALDRMDYHSAFFTCRKHRIDFNLLYDHNPEQFLQNIHDFIKQVESAENLNLFLSNLRDEDVTKTMYSKQPIITEKRHTLGKVNTICDSVRHVLETLETKDYIQSIITTHVRKTPPDLEAALGLLLELREKDVAFAEDALKFAIFLTDVDRLYDAALGMYEFGLVLMVAQQSQKDPREYLPFLQELRQLSKYYQRFKIDDHLRRYEKALKNLSLAGDKYTEDCLKYVQQHSLYSSALAIYAEKPEQKKAILLAYGEYLVQQTKFEEAAIIFSLAKDQRKALEAYRKNKSWRETLALAKEIGCSSQELSVLVDEAIYHLRNDRAYADIAVISMDYLQNIEDAVDALVKGSIWAEAIRLSYLHNRSDLIETHVKPGLLNGYTHLMEDLSEITDQFNKQTERLRLLRSKPHELTDLGIDESLDNIDILSDTTSMASGFTTYTSTNTDLSKNSSKNTTIMSSRSRRRQERKRARGKKGSVFEEEYLVNSLKKLITRTSSMQAEVGNILKALASYNYTEKAKMLQSAMEEIISRMQQQIDEIFVALKLLQIPSAVDKDSSINPPGENHVEKPVIEKIQWKLGILEGPL